MVVYPYLINNGFTLYKDIINPYPPFFSYSLSVFTRFFGYNPLVFQILTWATIVLIDLSVYFVTKKLFKKKIYAGTAVIFFTLVSTAFGINGLWFDLVQAPLIILSIYSFYLFLKTKKLLNLNYSLTSLTFAFFIKQQVIWLALVFVIIIFLRYKQRGFKILANSYKPIIFFALILTFQLLIFWQKNILSDFLYWTFYFPFMVTSHASGYISLPTIKQLLIILTLFIVFIPTVLKDQNTGKFLIGTAGVLLVFAFPRFDYFHLIPTLGILAIVFGKNIDNLKSQKPLLKFISIFALVAITVFSARLIVRNWQKETRFFENEIYQAAKVIDLTTDKNERVYIQNGPDQVLSIAQRLPPKPWADEFPWYLENTNLQTKVTEGIETGNVRLILFKPYNDGPDFGLGSYQPKKIVEFINQNYNNLSQISESLWLKSR